MKATQTNSIPPAFPVLRWVALAWLAVWGPAYVWAWGWPNFLHICDVTVILACIGLWRGSALLLSSQAISSILADLAWCLDAGWRMAFGQHLVGGTEYMWDASYPLWVRLLSLFHVVLPVLLVWSLRRVGYDGRGLLLQSSIVAVVLVLSRFFDPMLNLNFAHRDPIFQQRWQPAAAYLLVLFSGMVLLFYIPAHMVLSWALPQAREPGHATYEDAK